MGCKKIIFKFVLLNFTLFFAFSTFSACSLFKTQTAGANASEKPSSISLKELKKEKKYYSELSVRLKKNLEKEGLDENTREFLNRRLKQVETLELAFTVAYKAVRNADKPETRRALSILVTQLLALEKIVASLSPVGSVNKSALFSATESPSVTPGFEEIGKIESMIQEKFETKNYKDIVLLAEEFENRYSIDYFSPATTAKYAWALAMTGNMSKARVIAEEAFDRQLNPMQYAELKIAYSDWQKAAENELGAQVTLKEFIAHIKKTEKLLQKELKSRDIEIAGDVLNKNLKEAKEALAAGSLSFGEIIRITDFLLENSKNSAFKLEVADFRAQVIKEKEEFVETKLRAIEQLSVSENRHDEALKLLDALYERVHPSESAEEKIEFERKRIFSRLNAPAEEKRLLQETEKLQAAVSKLVAENKFFEAYQKIKSFITENGETETVAVMLVQTADEAVRTGRKAAAAIVAKSRKLPDEERKEKLTDALETLKRLADTYPETTLKSKLEMNISSLTKQLDAIK